MNENQGKSFEECIDIVDLSIQKQRKRWRLEAINWINFDDVEQILRIHIHSKWHMWDQERPLEPWLSKIITHQIHNLVRNLYGNYVKPCEKCPFNLGDNGCSATPSKIQCGQCLDYSKWEGSKKAALELKVPVSTESHAHELSSRPQNDFSYENSILRLNEQMKKSLTPLHYQAYYMLYFEEKSEEEVAKMMGYKTSEKKRKAGYRQIKNLKKMFLKKASEIMQEHDIIIDE